MIKQSCNRRKFIEITGLVLSVGVISGCTTKSHPATEKKPEGPPLDPCEDFTGISESDLQLRKGFGYVEASPIAESHCNNCNLWKPPAENQKCGGCTLFKGPVYDYAYCTYWAPVV